jgi:hypothetical protein
VEKKKPLVAWSDLEKNAEKILRTKKKAEDEIWGVMLPHVFSISDDTPKSETPLLYEYKLGAAYYYYPVDMIEACARKLKDSSPKENKK